MALLLPLHQAVLNLFNFHNIPLSDPEAKLFTSLKILDSTAVFTCIWHTIPQADPSKWHHHRCSRMLSRVDSLEICKAFAEFYYYAGDPVMKDDDEILQRHLTLFMRHFLCPEHAFSEWDRLRPLMLEFRIIMTVWRAQYLFRRHGESQEEPEDRMKTNNKRFSRLFKMNRKSVAPAVDKKAVEQMRGRSLSPTRSQGKRCRRQSSSLSSSGSGSSKERESAQGVFGRTSVAIVRLVTNGKERMEID